MAVPKLRQDWATTLQELVGSGDKIGLFTLPFLIVGLILNIAFRALFGVGGPPTALAVTCIAVLVVGVTLWLWSVGLILAKVPRGELITNGPFALMKHPIYTGFSLLVVPWIGFLLNTWLGALVGIVMYIGCRRYAPEEEAELSRTFGAAWDEYRRTVKIPWL
jgi:protein-S-isoprenylcysteine O-methyltransferase Ste14